MTAGTIPVVAVSIPEFARVIGISRRWALELVKRGEVRSFELAGKRLIPISELERISGVPISAPPEATLPGADRSPDPNSPGEQPSETGPHRDMAVGRAGPDGENAPRSAAAG